MPGLPRLRERYDLVVVGGGHAGLQAALKAALLRRTAAVIDRGPKYSRSFYAPRMDNIPGFPEGISGHRLLDQQVASVRAASAWVDYFTPGRAASVVRDGDGYAVRFDWLKQDLEARGRAVVLAMGVVDRIVEVGGRIDAIFPWANQAIVDFCVVCDGHELAGKSVGVLGHEALAARTALDLFEFAPGQVDILTHGRPPEFGATGDERAELSARLAERRVEVVTGSIAGFDEIREHRFGVRFADGSHRSYDRGFSALGWYDMHQAIPRSLGCRFDAEGFVVVDEDSRAIGDADGRPIDGLYVVGDQKGGWNQIPEAWASAERAVLHAWAQYL
ncbi:MAG TPA: FAD-dependent oxidoreductase [Thermoplasmata archaeon]|nr:FAD-dependent oxidoreductase [Thermoplasmata archaeon]